MLLIKEWLTWTNISNFFKFTFVCGGGRKAINKTQIMLMLKNALRSEGLSRVASEGFTATLKKK